MLFFLMLSGGKGPAATVSPTLLAVVVRAMMGRHTFVSPCHLPSLGEYKDLDGQLWSFLPIIVLRSRLPGFRGFVVHNSLNLVGCYAVCTCC
ncbi:hypothetical protein DFH27DRAFT_583485 [Peziza echinospora]|nr:hypothetical protein DFH27DRAFT_583485 [Peziza echinospora]